MSLIGVATARKFPDTLRLHSSNVPVSVNGAPAGPGDIVRAGDAISIRKEGNKPMSLYHPYSTIRETSETNMDRLPDEYEPSGCPVCGSAYVAIVGERELVSGRAYLLRCCLDHLVSAYRERQEDGSMKTLVCHEAGIERSSNALRSASLTFLGGAAIAILFSGLRF